MREIRPYGSARGVRRNLYPYRDTPPPDAVGGAKTWAENGASGRRNVDVPTFTCRLQVEPNRSILRSKIDFRWQQIDRAQKQNEERE